MNNAIIEVIVGPMFSGKSGQLINSLECLQYGNKAYIAFKPARDTRSGDNYIVSHDDRRIPAVVVETPEQILLELEKRGPVDVVGVDEMQFLDPSLVHVAHALSKRGISVMACGLDMDFRGMPFRTSADMMAIADSVIKVRNGYCSCGQKAIMSQLVDAKLAPTEGPAFVVGGKGQYRACCRFCHKIPS